MTSGFSKDCCSISVRFCSLMSTIKGKSAMFYPCEKIMADFNKVRSILEMFYSFNDGKIFARSSFPIISICCGSALSAGIYW